MRVFALSKQQFMNVMTDNGITDDNVESKINVMFITIDGTAKYSDKPVHTYFKRNHPNVKIMIFDDIENEIDGFEAFSVEMAKDLFRFIKNNRDKKTCVVHCGAGISRSAAVGLFIVGYCDGDYDLFKKEHPWISPNARVSRMLSQVWREDKIKK